jgi:DNA mismatch endonuclease, patch repair protein
MQRQRRRDTAPELELRRILHRRGFRYRVDKPALPGSRRRHDLVFPRARVAVEVRGCFWHSCPEHATLPKANAVWWAAKLAVNAQRDRDTAQRLEEVGWLLLVVWEHEDPAAAADRVAEAVTSRR